MTQTIPGPRMNKLDFRKRDKALYSGRPGRWDRIVVPPATYLAIKGQGAPEGDEYRFALGALYPVAYAVKFAMKAKDADFTVPPLQALWWADRHDAFERNDRSAWKWRAMVRIPDSVSHSMVSAAREKAAKKSDATALSRLELFPYDEGDCFQTLHIGPYSAEGPVLADLHSRVMPQAGVAFGMPHHEIYLSDFRRTQPEKLKTILRQPVVPL